MDDRDVQGNGDGPDEDDCQYNNLDNSGVDPETQINIQKVLCDGFMVFV